MSGVKTEGKLRTFIAIPVDHRVLETLQKVQRSLANQPAANVIQWTRPEQVHLTLKFMGNIPVDSLDQLASTLEEACEGGSPFTLRLDGLGCFPNSKEVRIIWIGLNGALETLKQLHHRIDVKMAPFSEHTEKRSFRPHLTLGRVKKTSRSTANLLAELIRATKVPEPGEWTVSEVHLVASEISSSGSVYTCLKKISL